MERFPMNDPWKLSALGQEDPAIAHRLWLALQSFCAICVFFLLLFTLRLYRFSYFYLDDFNNLHLTQHASGWSMLWYNTHPSTNIFRPVGFLAHWICLHLFDLSPFPYHLSAWIIHLISVYLVYLILRHASQNAYSAGLGSLLFAVQISYSSIFYNFGTTIFDLLAGLFYFLGLWTYIRKGASKIGLVLACVIYFLACNSKEMALTLPGAWMLYELIVNRSMLGPGKWRGSNQRRAIFRELVSLAGRFIFPSLIALWFVLSKESIVRGTSPSDPYRLHVSPASMVDGYGWYFNALYETGWPWTVWMAVAALLFCLLLLKLNRWGIFFLAYTFLTLLPVVFMTQHRHPHYWYIPFLGISGLAALALAPVVRWVRGEMSPRMTAIAGALAFAFFCNQSYFLFKELSRFERPWARDLSEEYRSFITGLRMLPQPEPDTTVYFRSVPRNFDSTTLVS
ncbi:MAG TPA: hypothetical protein VGQ81_04905, partial [Acidobacteriota bacterium]|nr:hypothetical protein [Acidobacteriota bacterium]